MSIDDGRQQEPATASDGLPDRVLAQAFGFGALVGFMLLALIWGALSVLTDDPVRPAARAGQAGLLDGSAMNADLPPARRDPSGA